MTRVGVGTDIHKLVDGRPLVIGGVTVPFDRGLSGHSDADVLTHAIIDALLGAASLGDIGEHFPSSDNRWLGVRSIELLELTVELLDKEGFRVRNIDSTVIAEAPVLSDWIPRMISTIAPALGIHKEDLSIKATTAKGLGPVGEGDAISAVSVALIEKVR